MACGLRSPLWEYHSCPAKGWWCSLQDSQKIENRALLARAVVLVGTCAGKLSDALWLEAFALVIAHVRHPDKVIKLAAVSALSNLMRGVIAENEVETS